MIKKVIVILTIVLFTSCKQEQQNLKVMKQANVIEMVYWSPKKGVLKETTIEVMKKLNGFVKEQRGFISRSTSVSIDGKFLDIVYWETLDDATKASELAMQQPTMVEVFSLIDEETMMFKHFDIFNSIAK